MIYDDHNRVSVFKKNLHKSGSLQNYSALIANLGFVNVTIPRFQYQMPPAHLFCLLFSSVLGG